MKEQEEWGRKRCEWNKNNGRKGSVSRGLRGVNGDALRERNLLEAT